MNVDWTTPWRVSLPKGVVLWSSDKKLLLNSEPSSMKAHTCKWFFTMCGSKTNPSFFLLFFSFSCSFRLETREKSEEEARLVQLFQVWVKKKRRKCKAKPVYGEKNPFSSFLISVASLHLMVVGPSPFAGRFFRGLPIVHSLHMWFRSPVRELGKKLEFFFRSQRVI